MVAMVTNRDWGDVLDTFRPGIRNASRRQSWYLLARRPSPARLPPSPGRQPERGRG